MADSVDKAFEDLLVLNLCLKRIHWFSSGVPGREMRSDGDHCASLGHWSLIKSGAVEKTSVTLKSLFDACRAGKADVIYTMNQYLDLNEADDMGWTALHIAMIHSDKAVDMLLQLGVMNKSTTHGVFASSLNIERWKRVTGHELIDKRYVPSTVEAKNATEAVLRLIGILQGSLRHYNETICGTLCSLVQKFGADVYEQAVKHPDHRKKWTVLTAAADIGNYSLCRVTIESGAMVNQPNVCGRTALHFACANNHIECVRLLLQHGADANKADNYGDIPLHAAAYAGDHTKCVRLLLQHGANVNKADVHNLTPLHTACAKDHIECARLLLQHGANVNKADNCGKTPLHIACANGRTECVRLLLQHGVNINETDNYRSTPLRAACANGRIECVRLLLQHGANMNETDVCGRTALHVACVNDRIECVRLLLQHGANANEPDNCENTPLNTAYALDRTECVHLLLHHGANANEIDESDSDSDSVEKEEEEEEPSAKRPRY